MQIRNKLTLRFSLLTACILIVFALSIYFFSYLYLSRQLQSDLEFKSQLTVSLMIKKGSVDSAIVNTLNKNVFNQMMSEELYLTDEKGKVLFNSFDDTIPANFEKLNDEANHNSYHLYDKKIFIALDTISEGNKIAVMMAVDNPYTAILYNLKILLVSLIAVALLIIIFSGIYFATQALKPVEKIISEVDAISASNLHNRLNVGNGQDELTHLASTFNKLLERMEANFILQRNFVANASHELRTPLSAITSQLEVTLMHNREAQEYKIVMASVLEDIRSLNSLSDALMDMTLADRDISLMKFAHIRVDELLLQSRDELLLKKPGYKVHIHFGKLPESENELTINGKEHLLKVAFKNLMDNACKYSSDKTAEIYLSVSDKGFEIKCVDKGIGIPQDYIQKLFTPLQRAENAKKIPGHGLGLALTKKIIEIHRGIIAINSGLNKGTTVQLFIPK